MNKYSKRITESVFMKCILAFLLTLGAFTAQYSHLVFNPNNQTFHSHGDLVVTHADLMYHVKYDDNSTFSGMNYPDGDFMFMTDANGSFATLFRFINDHIVNIEEVLPGIIMSLIYICLGICGLILFLILRAFTVPDWLALLMAPLLTLLSPQMARIVCHLSLSYPFVVPLVMLWCIRKYNVPKIEIRDLFFTGLLFFLFMNNAYIGFIMSMFAGVTGFVLFAGNYREKSKRASAIIMMAVPVFVTILVFFTLKMNDPYTDRLAEQWGFFHYRTRPWSFFTPRFSLLYDLLGGNPLTDRRSIEWSVNLGIVPLALVGSYWFYALLRRFKYKSWSPFMDTPPLMKTFLISSFLMVVFAANRTLLPIKDLIESHMDALLMFKASGRFSWPFYWVVTVFSILILVQWLRRLGRRNPSYRWLLLLPIFLIYGYEVNYYLGQIFGNLDADNYITAPQSDETLRIFDEAGVNKDTYQATISLPLLVGWNEKILAPVHNRTEKGALSAMALAGIPMINGRLSRNSTSKTLLATQLSSHPLIEKEALDLLDPTKPILLIHGVGAEDWLNFGEKSMIDNATEVFRTTKFIGYSITVPELRKMHDNTVAYAKDYYQNADSMATQFFVRESFDGKKSEKSLFGQGALQLGEGKVTILDTTIVFPADDQSTKVKFSVWTDITPLKYGMPEYRIKVMQEDSIIHEKVVISRMFKDVYNDWIRASHRFDVPRGEVRIEIISTNNQSYWIDELHLSSAKYGNSIAPLDDETFLLDNYLVK